MQTSFLNDDVVEHHAGPRESGQQEFLAGLLRQQVERMHNSVADWRPPELPDLSQFDEVVLDLETTGLRWWDKDRMIGAGLWTPDGQTRYLPIRHKVGPNIPEATFFEWMRREFRGKRVVNIRTKFDLHMLREDRIDLEAQGCTFGDVAHYAALLDDHRRLFNQADLVKAFLGVDEAALAAKVKTSKGYELDPSKFAEYPAGLVAHRAESDVLAVSLLQRAMWPRLTEEDLHRVRVIEDGIIPVVVEMEHNGAPIDVETLNRWVAEAQRAVEDVLWDIKRDTGFHMSSPNKHDERVRLFGILGIPIPIGLKEKRDPVTGRKTIVEGPSFADDLLEKIPNVNVQRLREGTQIASLLSKFLLKYQRSTLRDGILRYELHQLPYQDDDEGGGGGAVSGRFSSAAPSRDEGANIQQVIGVKNQLGTKDPATGEYTGFTRRWLVKNLFKPDRTRHPGAVWFKADASQFQFRLFAHYGNEPGIIAAYQDDARKALAGEALTDFHEVVQRLVLEMAKKELDRTKTKNVNFAQVFGAGIDKMAAQLGVTREVAQAISDIYHEMFPNVKPLLRITSHLAMPDHKTGDRPCGWACRKYCAQGYPHRGYVKTFLGRRARFGMTDRHYSALNRIIQGTEGDVNKRVMIEVHNLRHELGITERFTVHDELDMDLHEPGNLAKVKAVLNTQYYDFRVPILWEAGIGPTWGEAK